jgi:hypothetical protein
VETGLAEGKSMKFPRESSFAGKCAEPWRDIALPPSFHYSDRQGSRGIIHLSRGFSSDCLISGRAYPATFPMKFKAFRLASLQ